MKRSQVLLWSGVWLCVVVVFISQNIVLDLSYQRPIRWWQDVLFEILYWIPFMLATPLFVFMASRYPTQAERRPRRMMLQVAAGVAFALLQPLIAGLLTNAAGQVLFTAHAAEIAERTRRTYPVLVLTALWKYAVIIAVCLAVRYYRASQAALLRGARLERQIAAAQLSALKMQLHPHFLFNALHSAAMLTVTDPTRAHEVLVQLADLLRATLHTSAVLEVPLRAELEFLERYLVIERIRFEDRLVSRFDIGAGTADLLVPSLILQPLVENAIRHGLAPKSGQGVLSIHSRRIGDTLEIEVRDDGVGWNGPLPSFGIGLSNVQERVNAANRQPAPLRIVRTGETTSVTMRLPARPSR
jgi:hypothetical protein